MPNRVPLCILLLILTTISATAQPYLGVGHEWSEDPAGVRLTRIVPRSPAMICGLERGDIIFAIDGDTLYSATDLGRLLDLHRPGERITLLIRRCHETTLLSLILGDRADYTGIMRRGNRTTFPDSTTVLFPDLKLQSVDLLIEKTIDDFDLLDSYQRLRHAFFDELTMYHGHYTLDATAAALLEPRLVGAIGEHVLATSSCRNTGDAALLASGMFNCIDVVPTACEQITITDLSDVIHLLQETNQSINTAFAALAPVETAALATWCGPMLESFITTFYLHWEEDPELVENFESVITSTRNIDYSALARASVLLSALDDTNTLLRLEQSLRRDYGSQAADASGILLDTLITLLPVDTNEKQPQARLLIAADTDNLHTETVAVLLELGGDDLYLNNAGGTPFVISNGDQHHFRQGRVGICIDFGGDDRYFCNGAASCGGGLAGTGLLLDLGGDDTYSGSRLTQGSAFAGCGLLHDYAGDDVYLGQEAAQGTAFFGTGLLRDDDGDDSYSAVLYAQGCGGAKGCGLLLDAAGNDRFLATHKHPNGYGNEDSWSGWSQGVGVGFRQLAAGGIGLLCDLAGDDEFIAGNFSQGCGYFFGFGIFFDGDGDDRVTGNRYCQAALAHQAASYFCNNGGNDSYYGQEATNQGGTWDVGAALFIDTAGDDSYTGGSLSQGGSAQNSMAIFLDLEGRDNYSAGGNSQGAGGNNSYSDGRGALSLSLFFDLGGNSDSYADSLRGNDRQILTDSDDDPASGEGVFIDR